LAGWPAALKEKVKEIVISTSVTSISDSAFEGCSSLTSVDIPTSVTSIGGVAFRDCTSLANVAIPTSVTSLSHNAFRGCSSLTSVDIPTSVTRIGAYTFFKCSSLASVVIPMSVTSIDGRAFAYCSSLKSVVIPTSLTSIGDEAFNGCSSLASVVISTSVTSISGYAFQGCSSMTMFLVHPSDADAADDDAAGADSTTTAWSRLYAAYVADDSNYEEEEYEQLLPDTTKIWAPDTIVAQLTGQFEAFNRFVDVPRALRAAPDATTWAGVQLWLWWLPPSSFYSCGDGSDDGDDRVVCKSRVTTIWTTMLSAYKSSEVLDLLPDLEPELWEHIFTFLKHDQQPVFPKE